jgi:hypothetical protein
MKDPKCEIGSSKQSRSPKTELDARRAPFEGGDVLECGDGAERIRRF